MQSAVVTRPLTKITPDEALAAGRLVAKVWPHADRGPKERAEQLLAIGREYKDFDAFTPRSFLMYDGDLVIAHALVFPRTLQTETGKMTTLALAMVVSDPDYRGQGLGALIVRAAFEPVDSGQFPFCLFQTSDPVRPFYERMGACPVENQIINSLSDVDPEANPFRDDHVMRYPAEGDWPTGVIDLLGPGY